MTEQHTARVHTLNNWSATFADLRQAGIPLAEWLVWWAGTTHAHGEVVQRSHSAKTPGEVI